MKTTVSTLENFVPSLGILPMMVWYGYANTTLMSGYLARRDVRDDAKVGKILEPWGHCTANIVMAATYLNMAYIVICTALVGDRLHR